MIGTVTRLAGVLQTLFTVRADELAKVTQLVQRQRALRGSTWVQTLVFGWAERPTASLEDLTQVAADLGATISPQGLDHWFCPQGADTLLRLTYEAIATLVQTEPTALPLLQRFVGVYLEDCTTVALPACLAADYPGCGGNDEHGRDQAALKTFVRLELQQGNVTELSFLPGRQPDVQAGQQARPLPAGALRVKDLGFFDTQLLAQDTQHQVHWISRVPTGVYVQVGAAPAQEVSTWLAQQTEPSVDVTAVVGQDGHLRCRLIAVRCPEQVRQRRLRKLEEKARKQGRAVSARRREMCGWLVLITDLAAEQLTIDEAWVLYRARWQIELLFKLWKSHGRLDKSRGERADRVLCELRAKLLAMLLKHWLVLLAGPWLDGRAALTKIRQLKRLLIPLAVALRTLEALEDILAKIRARLARVRRRARRKKQPSTFDLLKNPQRAGLTLN
jgi:hypothetical protein